MPSKKSTSLVLVKVDGQEYWLPKGSDKLPPKQLFLINQKEITSKMTPVGLASARIACRYCLGCSKSPTACPNNEALDKFIKAHPQFGFFKKNPGPKDTVRVMVANKDITPEDLKAFYEVVNMAKTCPHGAPSVREFGC